MLDQNARLLFFESDSMCVYIICVHVVVGNGDPKWLQTGLWDPMGYHSFLLASRPEKWLSDSIVIYKPAILCNKSI